MLLQEFGGFIFSCAPGILELSSDQSNDRFFVLNPLKKPVKGFNRLSERDVAALDVLVFGVFHFQKLFGNLFSERRLCQGNRGRRFDDVGRRDQNRPGDGRKKLVKDFFEFVLRVHGRQVGNNKNCAPFEKIVLMIQVTDKKVDVRIQKLRLFLTDDAKNLVTTVFDVGFVGFQPLKNLGKQFRILDNLVSDFFFIGFFMGN
jgi:hypothetical protein